MELRMYEYRLYPTQKQQTYFLRTFKHCRFVWNELLGLNKKMRVTNSFDLNGIVRDIKICDPTIGEEVYAQVLQNVSNRLSKSFDNFFRRVKEKKQGKNVKAGYPRFKSKITSITYPQDGFKLMSNRRLRISKIGNVPIVLHRAPKGKIKTMTIKMNPAGQWFATFACEIDFPKIIHPHKEKDVGIDVGLTTFATLSDGTKIENPRFLRAAETRLKHLQRGLSRKVKGSKNRNKARIKLARAHLKVSNIRRDWLHKQSHTITQQYGSIYNEKLNITNMVKNHTLAKSIHDASWGQFFQMLSYKAVTSGGYVGRVDPKGTTSQCYKCNTWNDMPLNRRIFECVGCGFTDGRDKKASEHIQQKGRAGRVRTTKTLVDIEPLSLIRGKVSSLVEARTIPTT